ncbi:N-acetylornithine carbamoyltransferase [Dyadobacter fanqingshengii]|uniref:N-succinylornithine carbamoyltransferase n=1 Tax=Dyadobacter fanqingshengii TaxID=2906443 RepID=A0A9X1P6M9_9BACT|nr:N-acetylornithine carbamoyltransferase [Dyadobacter fanqingshengii]MCF0038927.1 N-acetylornithine carbamoyltransferase [Dyadobacter fanqingshengii]MCF2503530.1 N-acetylornithine carbamoyltransferase [Dyadobacter fanqingshengii]USJ34250.1 N-acetylornithine carbamoyltransferase [Dyadobacter fanqingshengii]
MKHFLSINDVTDLNQLITNGIAAKRNPFADIELGKNKTIGLLFFNSSLRTRISTQKAAQNLGLNVITMNVGQDGWGLEMEEGVIMNGDKAEHVKEAAAVIGSYCDIIGIRSFAGLQDRDKDYAEIVFQQFKKYAEVPIINLESATRHPLQSLADCITIEEFKIKQRPKVVLTWLPHFKALPQAVANSFCEWMNPMDVELVITHPQGYDLSPEFVGKGQVIYDQDKALEGADFVYGKNWSSYQSYGQVLTSDPSWMITEAKMALTDNGKFMHCLPLRRNMKVADEVLDGPRSLVIEQAANREWSAQAALREVLLHI